MIKTVYASEYAHLDSDVYTGGGTDDTGALQALLDKAVEWGELTSSIGRRGTWSGAAGCTPTPPLNARIRAAAFS